MYVKTGRQEKVTLHGTIRLEEADNQKVQLMRETKERAVKFHSSEGLLIFVIFKPLFHLRPEINRYVSALGSLQTQTI